MLACTVMIISLACPVEKLGTDPQRKRPFQQSWLHSWPVNEPTAGLWMANVFVPGLCWPVAPKCHEDLHSCSLRVSLWKNPSLVQG